MTKSPSLEMLTAILPLGAEIDVIHTPVRRLHPDGGHRAMELRMEFRRSGGLPYAAGGTASERKASERLADEWEAAGLVVCSRCRSRRVAWRLSDAADWALRSLAGDWPDPWGGLQTAMLCIDAHTKTGHTHESGFVPEVALLGMADWKAGPIDGRVYELESLLLPGLVRDLVRSGSDCYGRVGYLLTDRGRKWLESPPDPPDLSGVSYCSEASRQHFDAFMVALKRLDSEKPRLAAVYIPLSAGLWPEGKPAAPGVFSRAGKLRTVADYRRLTKRTGTAGRAAVDGPKRRRPVR